MSIDQILVIPCYNESLRFRADSFARALAENPTLGLLFVNDGSRDTTETVLKNFAQLHASRCALVNLSQNSGTAEAVRQGFLEAFRGVQMPWATESVKYIGYWDCDLATPLTELPAFVEIFEKLPNLALVMGARIKLLGRSISRLASRHYLGRIFATAASWVLKLPVYDTQCGAKLFIFDARTASYFSKPFISSWIFDVEILARMSQDLARLHEGDMGRVYEYPLREWKDVDGSKVKPSDFLKAFISLVRIALAYPQVKSLRKGKVSADLS